MSDLLRLLLVEDSPSDAKLLLRELDKAGFKLYVERVETAEEMTAALRTSEWSLVISDYRLPTFSGPGALALIKELELDVPFIIVSGTVGEANAVAAMKAGAHDYVMKDNLTRLAPAITRELQDAVMRRERREADAERERVSRENERLLREIAAVAMQQRAFLRDILFSVTEGKLILCDSADDLPIMATERIKDLPLTLDTMREVRVTAQNAALSLQFSEERCMDLTTAVGEATMNAIVHGGGGHAYICVDDACVRIRVDDQGKGIDLTTLPRATLERGYTTGGSLGHGFFMMLSFVDRVYLVTGSSGTTLILEQNRIAPEPEWLRRAGALDVSMFD